MKCNHCGAENNEGAKFCSNCGTPIQIEKEATASETVKSEQAQTASETKKGFSSAALIGLTLSAIAFIAGLVLYSIMIKREFLIYGPDTIVFIPAFAGLAFGIHALLHGKDFKNKIVSIASISMAGFAIFYGFLTYAICLG